MNKKAKSMIGKDARIEKINHFAAGVDIGSRSHFIAISSELAEENVREFKSFTEDLNEAIQWLKSYGITTVAMESTGIYWVNFYDMLEQSGFEVLLVNARHVKNVPGRKSDVLDCQWLQQLHSYGLLRGSFRPNVAICALRGYMRHRETLVKNLGSQIQLMQKSLMQMNIQLQHVISDITGVTGLKIIRKIVQGERDLDVLASFRDKKCQSDIATIKKALTGNLRSEHLFTLKQQLELYDFYHLKLSECDAEIEKTIKILEEKSESPTGKLDEIKRKPRRKNEMYFDVREELFNLVGVDLTKIDGINGHTALKIISEIGTDMSRWPTVKHFTSWLGLAPGTKISGGKVLSSATKKCINKASNALRMAAQTLHHSHSYLGAFLRKKKAQLGSPKAITATAHKLANIVYLMLKYKTAYIDLGEHYYEKKYKESIKKKLIAKAASMGLALVENPCAATT